MYDVIVVGGGVAGCAAAVSAAREGAHTLLIERYGFLGGWATAGLVNPFMSHRTSDGVDLVSGFFSTLKTRLASMPGAILDNTFDPELIKCVLQEMVLDQCVQVRLHTLITSAQTNPDGSTTVGAASKSGAESFNCKVVVDCSGDGDAAAALGAVWEMGDEKGLAQAVTLMFDVGGVDLSSALTYVQDHPEEMRFPKHYRSAADGAQVNHVVAVAGYYTLVQQARDAGQFLPPGDIVFYVSRPRYGEVTFNTTHIGSVNPLNTQDLTRAEIDGRRQMTSVVDFARTYLPGFENCYLVRTPVHVGVRESRRIVGDYVFSEDDVAAGRKFKDGIARLAYYVDIHRGTGEGYTKSEEREMRVAPPSGDYYGVPYRCLLPKGLDGLLVAGRCISSTHAGQAAIRIMPCCMATGEAAGTAAALAVAARISPRNVSADLVRRHLLERGAIV